MTWSNPVLSARLLSRLGDKPSSRSQSSPGKIHYGCLENSYAHGPVSAIKRRVVQLIDLQIETLKQRSSIDSSQRNDYQTRFERIRKLYEERTDFSDKAFAAMMS